jgi:hypothetical protein
MPARTNGTAKRRITVVNKNSKLASSKRSKCTQYQTYREVFRVCKDLWRSLSNLDKIKKLFRNTNTAMRRLTTAISSDKCVVRRYCPCANVTVHLHPDSTAYFTPSVVGRDGSVGTATGYGLDGPGIESRWRQVFSAPVQTGPGAHPVPVQ